MFKKRSTQSEMLDNPMLDNAGLHQNLREFKIINRWLGSQAVLIDSLNKVYKKYPLYFLSKEIRIADLGCGGGDLLLGIQSWANENKLKVDLWGLDSNASIIEYARNNTANIQYEQVDILSSKIKAYNFDIICLNNVCHHFTDDEIIQLLIDLHSKINLCIIINDLRRNPVAYYAIKWITDIFNLSTMAKHDGPVSVLRSFTESDLIQYLTKSNIKNYQIKRAWAFRWQMIIECLKDKWL